MENSFRDRPDLTAQHCPTGIVLSHPPEQGNRIDVMIDSSQQLIPESLNVRQDFS